MDGRKVSGPPTLPARFTRFFGREAEINEVEGLTARARVLTLTGAPGCGKTRLSIEIADRLKAGFSDGVRFVGLALIPGQNSVDERGQARQVWSAIAWALGIVEPKRSDAAIVWRVANGVELPTAGARPGDERLRSWRCWCPLLGRSRRQRLNVRGSRGAASRRGGLGR